MKRKQKYKKKLQIRWDEFLNSRTCKWIKVNRFHRHLLLSRAQQKTLYKVAVRFAYNWGLHKASTQIEQLTHYLPRSYTV